MPSTTPRTEQPTFHRRRVPAIGSELRSDGTGRRVSQRRVICGFDHETFDQIRTRAVREGTSFAEQVRVLCEWGLEAEAS